MKATFLDTGRSSGNTSSVPATDAPLASDEIREQFSSLWQGGSAVIHPSANGGLSIEIGSGNIEDYYAHVTIDGKPLASTGGNSPAFSVPITHDRIDIVSIKGDESITITLGVEATSPVPNYTNVPVDALMICSVYCRRNMTGIVNFQDKATNPLKGYIYKDLRPFINFKTERPLLYSTLSGRPLYHDSGWVVQDDNHNVNTLLLPAEFTTFPTGLEIWMRGENSDYVANVVYGVTGAHGICHSFKMDGTRVRFYYQKVAALIGSFIDENGGRYNPSSGHIRFIFKLNM